MINRMQVGVKKGFGKWFLFWVNGKNATKGVTISEKLAKSLIADGMSHGS